MKSNSSTQEPLKQAVSLLIIHAELPAENSLSAYKSILDWEEDTLGSKA